jgi:transcriptional regulator with XRE-family HTH domain
MTFGEKLKELRVQAGLTQAQLAEVSSVPLGTIRDYEQGKRDPLLSTAQKLARALKQSLDVFPPEARGKAEDIPRTGRTAGAAPRPGRGKRPRKAAAAGKEREPKSGTGR